MHDALEVAPEFDVVYPAPQAEQTDVDDPLTEYVPIEQKSMTALLEAEQGTVTRCPGPGVTQVDGHSLACVPLTEYVPVAQAVTTALLVAVHADVTRCPAPATAQTAHVAEFTLDE